MLYLVYTNIQHAYKASPLPHNGQSDHISILFTPVYRPINKRIRPTFKEVKTWPEGAKPVLQDCFECTDWDMFREANHCTTMQQAQVLGDTEEPNKRLMFQCVTDQTLHFHQHKRESSRATFIHFLNYQIHTRAFL